MKKNENKRGRQVQAVAIGCCLCLLAVGAGVTYRAFDGSHLKENTQEAELPVTSVKSPTIEIAVLERNQQSNDPGELPAEETMAKPREKQTFSYPLQGEVVLPYSMDHAIYDPTLEQYRTNASISFSAEQGVEVKAAAAGTVQDIAEDSEMGKTITIAHDDGWLTTYGQLEEAVKVKKGEKVQQGQAIGSVDMPTKYGVALGTHLEFAMEQNGQPKDPMKYLEKAK
ncbi:MAG: M23 family metallopeptidase [Anaerotignum sp.]|nr:M23 family metallopeptidase [Anaerotignum sp.]